MGPANEEEVAAWFDLCDHNTNGWLSYRETEFSLSSTTTIIRR